ncbi:YlqD family protein [Bacillus aquiflavi]|uniref:YlqD family protein n=1 Tax=Bacillus aquiflavi TaxID=2672567 RepID=A0A6B3VRF8_9BACI|nr:YlqD family protein [Bacillus aquiflavi]MBA4536201.1 YlqD family protein [Bacillus aquiflavi]NEY80569.1 hypothetical protein [Bacillus aquiflavi]UAC49388.1 YlqD family protein [Bacillus aquiflavi]
MKILQTVMVKQILTEKSKRELMNKFHSEKSQLHKESDQLYFELKKLEKAKKFQSDHLRKHFEKEIQLRKEKMKIIDFQIEQLHMLPIGSELKEKEVQGIVDVNEGDCWEEIINEKTIIIKDGIVQEIRSR